MAPKAVVEKEGSGETRRSTRIASQPKIAEPEVKLTKKPSTKKRAANDNAPVSEDKKSTKKAKVTEKEEEKEEENAEEQDELKDDDKVDIGGQLPSMTLRNEKDEEVNIAELAKDKGVILFLVPKADTPGCTKQACGFRDSYDDVKAHDYIVICLSADTPAAQSKWQSKKSLPYSLISDPKRQLITALGAGEGGKTKRSHFIFEKGGKLVSKMVPVKPEDSLVKALEFIKSQKD